MTQLALTRRAALAALTAAFGLGLRPALALETPTAMRVVKDPACGCCGAWVEIIEAAGFAVTVEMMDHDALQAHKAESGIPADLASCHTAHVEGYVIEGHVPVADIRRLLQDRPDAMGLSVAGMPYGSPGMGDEADREAYTVTLIRRDGTAEVFATYDAA